MTGSPVTGAIDVSRCLFCTRITVPCTSPACIGQGAVHLMTRLHKCGNGLTVAVPVLVRTPGGAT